jgi:hypothetical protein
MMFVEKKLQMSRRTALALPLFAMIGSRPGFAQLAGSQDTGKIDPLLPRLFQALLQTILRVVAISRRCRPTVLLTR